MNDDKTITIGPRSTIGEFITLLNEFPPSFEISCCGQEEFILRRNDEDETIELDIFDEPDTSIDAIEGDLV